VGVAFGHAEKYLNKHKCSRTIAPVKEIPSSLQWQGKGGR